MSFANKSHSLKVAIENCGGFDNFVEGMLPDLINEKDGKPALMKPEDFSLKEIYEAVNSSQFPILTGTLLSKKIVQAFQEYPGIADELITKFTSKLKTDTIPGGFTKSKITEVPEGGAYPHSADMEEFYTTIGGEKRGEILDITEEAIMFDQTGIIMMRAGNYGREMAKDREKSVILTIMDATKNGKNYYAYYPGGSRLALYRTSDGTSSNVGGGIVYKNAITDVLADFSDIDAAETLVGLMKDENGDPIDTMSDNMVLLTSRALKTTGQRIVANQKVPNTITGVGYDQDNPYYGLNHKYSPWVDYGNGGTYWYYGDFKRQFLEKVVIPLQVLIRKDNKTDAAFERDIVAQYKIRRFSQVGAIDHRFVIESSGGA